MQLAVKGGGAVNDSFTISRLAWLRIKTIRPTLQYKLGQKLDKRNKQKKLLYIMFTLEH